VVNLLERAPQEGVIHGSKAVGEPPLMLAISVVSALRHAVSAFGVRGEEVDLRVPCTPEAVLRAVEGARARRARAQVPAPARAPSTP
jgi:xanthine dehydrogenase large subunit